MKLRATLLSFVIIVGGFSAAHAAGLNDSGIVLCGDAASNTVDCSSADPDPAGYPRQDGRFGRAAMDAAGVLYKVGASSSLGFDFTKIANNGTELAADAALGSGASDWACTRDNVTGLTWEVKVNDNTHLRHKSHTYTWYDTDTTRNGNNSGSVGGNTCNATLPSSQCNTQAYVAAVNTAQLCGYNDWRMPHKDELLGLVDQSKQGSGSATIDSTYFPNATTNWHWSGTNFAAGPANAWYVAFDYGGADTAYHDGKADGNVVRLVRGGQ
jgi:hypothetical protein